MQDDLFSRDMTLPYFECRYSEESTRDFKAHLHHRFSVGAIKKGSVQFNHAGQEFVLTPGTLALINPETIHSCNTLSNNSRSFYMLYLDPAWCLTVQQTIWSLDSFCPVSTCFLSSDHLYRRYCQTMDKLMDRKIFLLEKEQLLTEMVRAIFLAFSNNGNSPGQRKIPQSTQGMSIATAKELLAENLQADISLADIAARLQVTPFTLIRRFKTEIGTTPHAYRMNCRIEHARSLLQTDHDIADTAYECGFYDQSHFHRQFKAMTTVTPQEYKLNFQN